MAEDKEKPVFFFDIDNCVSGQWKARNALLTIPKLYPKSMLGHDFPHA